MGSILSPASSALAALGGVAQGLSQIVRKGLQLAAAPFALVGDTAQAAGSVLAGGEVAISNTTDVQTLEGVSETLVGGSAIETPVNENTASETLNGGGASASASASETLVGGGASATASETLVGGGATSETIVGGGATSETLVGGCVEAPVFIPLPSHTGMSGGARSRKRRASPRMRNGRKGRSRSKSRSKSRSRSRSRSRSGGKKKRTQKRKASPRRHHTK